MTTNKWDWELGSSDLLHEHYNCLECIVQQHRTGNACFVSPWLRHNNQPEPHPKNPHLDPLFLPTMMMMTMMTINLMRRREVSRRQTTTAPSTTAASERTATSTTTTTAARTTTTTYEMNNCSNWTRKQNRRVGIGIARDHVVWVLLFVVWTDTGRIRSPWSMVHGRVTANYEPSHVFPP
jgi:hypothetical protein